MAETQTLEHNPEEDPLEKEESERFSIVLPPALWARVQVVMARNFLGKTAIVCQALDLFVTTENANTNP